MYVSLKKYAETYTISKAFFQLCTARLRLYPDSFLVDHLQATCHVAGRRVHGTSQRFYEIHSRVLPHVMTMYLTVLNSGLQDYGVVS